MKPEVGYDSIKDVFFSGFGLSVSLVVLMSNKDYEGNKKSSITENVRMTDRYNNTNTENCLNIYAPRCGIVMSGRNIDGTGYSDVWVDMFSVDLLVEYMDSYCSSLSDFSSVFKYEDGKPISVLPKHASYVQIGPFRGKSMFMRPGIDKNQNEVVDINLNNEVIMQLPIDIIMGIVYVIKRMDIYQATRNLISIALHAGGVVKTANAINTRKPS